MFVSRVTQIRISRIRPADEGDVVSYRVGIGVWIHRSKRRVWSDDKLVGYFDTRAKAVAAAEEPSTLALLKRYQTRRGELKPPPPVLTPLQQAVAAHEQAARAAADAQRHARYHEEALVDAKQRVVDTLAAEAAAQALVAELSEVR